MSVIPWWFSQKLVWSKDFIANDKPMTATGENMISSTNSLQFNLQYKQYKLLRTRNETVIQD